MTEFVERHWPCGFSKNDIRCVLKKAGHTQKGHQSAKGKILGIGGYQYSYHLGQELGAWKELLKRVISPFQWSSVAVASKLHTELHTERLHSFYSNTGSANEFKSHTTCFCCLTAVPLHPLPCGHVLCDSCARMYGKQNGKESVEILECPLENQGEPWQEPRVIKIFPPLAGIRVLCLDG